MKHGRKPIWKLLSEVLVMSLLLSLLSGCFGKKPAASGTNEPTDTNDTPAETAAEPVMPGTLCGVRWESSGGVMNPHSDFEIEVTPEEIVHTEYYAGFSPEDDWGSAERTVKDHVPLPAEQWADIEKIVTILFPLMKEITPSDPGEKILTDENGEEVFILDGGDYDNWYLTWEKDGEKTTVPYYMPSDRRITTLTALLREAAEPVGREIVWYEPPVPSGMFFHQEEGDVSFQFTRRDDGSWRFIAYWREGDNRPSLDVTPDASVWENEVGPFLNGTDWGAFPSGWSYHDPVTITIYRSDNTQFTVQPDEAAVKRILDFFGGLRDRMK